MTCRDLRDLIEPIAAGDVEPDAAARAHLESCPRCAAALAAARRIEAVLATTEKPSAPAHFTPVVLARIRRERWQSEQHVDRLFNVAIAAAIVLVVGGAAALFNLSGVLAGAAFVWSVLSAATSQGVAQAAPLAGTYVAAACLLVSALGMWWWAERRLSL
jgi:anti-sigma factor RsiW